MKNYDFTNPKYRKLQRLLWDFGEEFAELVKEKDNLTTSDYQGIQEATINRYIKLIEEIEK